MNKTKQLVRTTIALALALGGLTLATTPASATVCPGAQNHSTTYPFNSWSVRSNCESPIRVTLYYMFSPNSPSTYSQIGNLAYFPNISQASRYGTYYAGHSFSDH